MREIEDVSSRGEIYVFRNNLLTLHMIPGYVNEGLVHLR
jgi:hypothetical protein